MELRLVRADPAGNITIFVLDRMEDPALRRRAARALLADPALGAEQVGFAIPPAGAAGPALWRLEMMGDEFCANAARSFGLYAARESGLRGKQEIRVGISGAPDPLPVRVDLEASTAELEIPGPRAEAPLSWKGRSFPVLRFEGITHLIAEGLAPDRELVLGLAEALGRAGGRPLALGVMFYDPARRFMRPAVYVAATESLVLESSCGSGTAALAAWLAASPAGDPGAACWDIAQPGGLIRARVTRRGEIIESVAIGGPVGLDTRGTTLKL
jgi:diaminopimelate epimerase